MPGLLPAAQSDPYSGPTLEPVEHDPFGDALQGVSDWAAQPDQTNDVKRAQVLPLEFTRQPGDAPGTNALTGVSLAVPGMIKGLIGDAVNALQAPRAVLSGQMTPEQAASATTPLLVDLAGGAAPQEARPGVASMFVGENAADHAAPHPAGGLLQSDLLGVAKNLHLQGATPMETWRDTGWYFGKDGNWKREIPDDGAKTTFDPAHITEHRNVNLPGIAGVDDPKSTLYPQHTLGDILDHPELYKAYPELAHVPVGGLSLGEVIAGTRGAVYKNGAIGLGRIAPDEALSTLLHEAQHKIQGREGFATGGNPEEFLPANHAAGKKLATENVKGAETLLESDTGQKPPMQLATYVNFLRQNGSWDQMSAFNQRWFAKEHAYLQGVKDPNLVDHYVDMVRKLGPFKDAENEAFRQYESLSGEIEARNVQERHKQGDYETFPEGHPDYPAGDQITRFGAPGSGFEASIPGWHGTPHEFEPVEHNPFGQFDDSKMGTGEGAQVRGWGHYLAGNPQTAISYRDALAGDVPRHVIMDNGNFSEGFDSHRYDPAMPNFGRENALFEFWGNGGDLAQTQRLMKNKKEQADNTVQSLANRLAVETSPVHRDRQAHMLKLAQQAAKGYQDALDTVAKEGHTWTLPEPNGHLLHVEMHPEEHELLDLDRTVAKQHPDVQKKLWALPGPIGDVFTHDMSSNGEDIQDSIRDHFHQGLSGGGWSDAGDNALHNQAHKLTKDLPPELSDWDRAKAATSRLLDQAGIPGNRFLDQGSRSAAPEIKLDGQRLESIPSTLDDGSPKTIFDYSPEELVRDRLYRELNYGSSHYEGPAGVKELIEDTKEHFEKEIENRKEWETPGNFFYQKDVVPTVPHYEAALKWLKENAQKLQWHEPEVTHNYVMFHPRHVTIKGRNGQMLEPVEHNPFEGLE